MTAKKEIRSCTSGQLKVETREDGKATISGYAAVFNSDSVDFGFFREVIRPGAFERTLKEDGDVRAFLDHDSGRIVGRTKAGNLSLREDDKGLKIELNPIDTEDGRKAIEWVRSGVVDGMSFGFFTVRDQWSTKDGKSYRELIDVDLFEVSLVAFPAYTGTSAGIRAAEQRSQEEIFKEYSDRVKQQREFRARKIRLLALRA